MRCLKIYDRLAGMQACRSCGSTYVVHYEEEKKKSKTPPASTSPQPSTSAPADALKVTLLSGDTETSKRGEIVMKASTREDFSSDTMDVNLQLHLRLTFFRVRLVCLLFLFLSPFPFFAVGAQRDRLA